MHHGIPAVWYFSVAVFLQSGYLVACFALIYILCHAPCSINCKLYNIFNIHRAWVSSSTFPTSVIIHCNNNNTLSVFAVCNYNNEVAQYWDSLNTEKLQYANRRSTDKQNSPTSQTDKQNVFYFP